MKKLIFVAFFILYTIILSAQSFYKGALVVDANVGIDVYDTKYTYKLKNTTLDTTINDKAANHNFSFGAEYGVLNFLGVGLRLKPNTYFVSKDEVTGTTPSVKSLDYMLSVNFHAVRNNVFNLVTGINFGGTNLKYLTHDLADNRIYGRGTYFDLHVSPRLYIKRFGFQLDFNVPFVNYNKLTSNNSTFNDNVLAKWKGAGYTIAMGIQFRFLKNKNEKEKTNSSNKNINVTR